MRHINLIKRGGILLVVTAILIGGFFVVNYAFSAVSVTPASDGTNISIDTTSAPGGTPAFSNLSGPGITENLAGDIATGVHTITLPAGWKFDMTSKINIFKFGGTGIAFESTSITPGLTSFSFNVTHISTAPSNLGFSGLSVMPTGTAVSSGDMTMTEGTIAGVNSDGKLTNFGTLSTVASTVAKVAFSIQPGATTVYGSNLSTQPVVQTQDYFGNPSTNGLGTDNTVVLSLKSATGAILGTNNISIDTGTATFTDLTIDEIGDKQLTATVGNLTPADSSIFTVTPRTLTATITVDDKVYDGNPSAHVTGFAFDNLVSGDEVIPNSAQSIAIFADSNAGQNKTVTASGVDITGTDVGNYSYDGKASTAAEHGADISKLGIIITPTPGQTKVYDNNVNTVLTYSPSPALIDGAFTGVLGRVAGENVGTYAYTLGTLEKDLDNYALTLTLNPATDTFAITPRPITVEATASSKPYDGNTTSAGIPTITAGTPLATGDTAGFIETYDNKDKNNISFKELRPSGIVNDGNGGNNYSYTFSNKFNGTITAKELTVTGLSATNKPYDGNIIAGITGDPSLVGVVGSENVHLTGTAVGTFNTKDVGINKTVTISDLSLIGDDKANYSLTQPTLNATISAKAITIIPNASQTNVYGQNDPVFGYTHTALIGTDDVTGALGRAGDKNVGTYTYTLGNLSASANYSLALGDGPSGPSVGAINLKTAGNYVILAKSLISTTGTTAVTGNMGISPAAASFVQGFGLVPDSTGCFSTADPVSLVTGKVYAANYDTNGCATPAELTTAVGDMMTAYTNASAPATPAGTDATNLNVGGGTLNGLNFTPGTYTWNSAVNITGDITLTGSATDVWIFQVNGILDIASGKKIILAGALPKNIFWQVTGAVTLVTGSTFEGNILAKTNIAMQSGATLHGRALAQTEVTLIANTVTIPESGSSARTFEITKKLLTVTATGINKEYNADATATVNLHDDRVAGNDLTLGYTATFSAGKNVGDNKTVNVTGISIIGGADKDNYTLNGVTTTSATANITPAPLTATITVDPREYDGNKTAPILTRTLVGKINGDTVTLNADGTATFADKNVGTSKTISAKDITLAGDDKDNYSFTQPSLNTGVITQRILNVTATGINKEYNADATATVNLSDDRVSGDVLTLSGVATFADKNVANNKAVSVVNVTVTGTDAGNYNANTTAATAANITQKTLTATITVDPKVYDGNNTAIITGYTSDKIGSDNITLSGGTATFADAIANNNKDVTATGITITDASTDKGNYSYGGAATGKGNILEIPMTVYVDKTYTDGSAGVHTFGYDAFSTIQNGIDKVATNGTVNVAAGNYPENVKIFSRNGLTIKGVGDGTLIAGNGYGIEIDASNNITIKDLKISTNGPDLHGIYVDGNYVSGRGVSPSNNLTIQNTTISATGGVSTEATGIYADYVTNGPHTGWTITGNRITADGGGIGLEDVTNSTVSNNVSTITNGTNILWLAVKSDLSTLVVSGNTVNGSGGSQVSFLTDYHPGSAGKTITGVTFHGNTSDTYGSRALKIGAGVSGVVADHNKFLGAIKPAILNESATSVNAESNWWGTAVKSTIQSKISDKVAFEPYYIDVEMTKLSNVAVGVVYVDKTYTNDSAGDHIFGYDAFAKIQDGIDAVASGGTVNVTTGTYIERLRIENKPISLLGADKANTFLQGTAGPADEVILIKNNTTGATVVSGFTIDAINQVPSGGWGATGIWIQGSESVTIQDNDIVNFRENGVFLGYGSNNNIVKDNTITGSAGGSNSGINIYDDSGNNIIGGAVANDGNIISLATNGTGNLHDIYLSGTNTKNNTIKNNTINGGKKVLAQDFGVSGTTTFSSNTIGNITSPSVAGIYVDGGKIDMKGNVMTFGDINQGIFLNNNSGPNTIGGSNMGEGNQITMPEIGSSLLYAINLGGADTIRDCTIKRNTFNGAKRAIQIDGPQVNSGGTITVQGNTINQTLYNDEADGSSHFGAILSYNKRNLVIKDNVITNSTRPIEFMNAIDVTISGNTISGAKYSAINAGSYSGTVLVSDKNSFINMPTDGTYTIQNQGSAIIDATKNWWGVANGAAIALGVSTNVNYLPWCTNDTCATLGYDIPLNTGWNLISLPLIPTNSAIGTVLADISSKVNVVWSYENGAWSSYKPTVGGTLAAMEDGKGYWVYMNAPDTLIVKGTETPPVSSGETPPSEPRHMYTFLTDNDWNLIGFKSVSEMKAGDYIDQYTFKTLKDNSLLWYYNNDTNSYSAPLNKDNNLNSGYGYWLLLK